MVKWLLTKANCVWNIPSNNQWRWFTNTYFLSKVKCVIVGFCKPLKRHPSMVPVYRRYIWVTELYSDEIAIKYCIQLIFRGYFIYWKKAKVGFTKFSQYLISRTGLWAWFPDLLNQIFMIFNFANGHRFAKERNFMTGTWCMCSELINCSFRWRILCKLGTSTIPTNLTISYWSGNTQCGTMSTDILTLNCTAFQAKVGQSTYSLTPPQKVAGMDNTCSCKQ